MMNNAQKRTAEYRRHTDKKMALENMGRMLAQYSQAVLTQAGDCITEARIAYTILYTAHKYTVSQKIVPIGD